MCIRDRCKATRRRELLRQELFLKEEKENLAQEQQELNSNDQTQEDPSNIEEITTSSGNQIQSQAQLNSGTTVVTENVIAIKPFDYPQPVSYTHLDVYKRQVQNHWSVKFI